MPSRGCLFVARGLGPEPQDLPGLLGEVVHYQEVVRKVVEHGAWFFVERGEEPFHVRHPPPGLDFVYERELVPRRDLAVPRPAPEVFGGPLDSRPRHYHLARRRHAHALNLPPGPLVLGAEVSQRPYLVPDELDPHRVFGPRRIYVHDSPPGAYLSGALDEIERPVTRLSEPLRKLLPREKGPGLDFRNGAPEGLHRHRPFEKSPRLGDNNPARGRSLQPRHAIERSLVGRRKYSAPVRKLPFQENGGFCP